MDCHLVPCFCCLWLSLVNVRWMESTFPITTVLSVAMAAFIWLVMLKIIFLCPVISSVLAPFCSIRISLTFAWSLWICWVHLAECARRCCFASGRFGVAALVLTPSGMNGRGASPAVWSMGVDRRKGRSFCFPQCMLKFVVPLHPWVACPSAVGFMPVSVKPEG